MSYYNTHQGLRGIANKWRTTLLLHTRLEIALIFRVRAPTNQGINEDSTQDYEASFITLLLLRVTADAASSLGGLGAPRLLALITIDYIMQKEGNNSL